jgi:hypothetical protein
MTESENTGSKQAGRFRKGQSGNPKGKRPGTRNAALIALDRIGQDAAQGLLQTVIEKAMSGDMTAARILLDRAWPVRKGRPIRFETPSIQTPADIMQALSRILDAVGSGQLTPEEGQALASLIESQRKAIETTELDSRITELERRLQNDTRNQN